MALFVAPPARQGVAPQRLTSCDDKVKINAPGGYRYNQPCSSCHNYRSHFDPTSKKPQRVPDDFDQHSCKAGSRLHPREPHHHYSACRYCVAAVERHPWHTTVEDNFLGLQPHNSTSNNTNHFLTRLCGICEEREIQLVNQRSGVNNTIAPVAPSQAMRDKMEDYPDNTCTCKKSILDTLHLCLDHRRERYFSKIPRLHAQRDLNRTWLQSIERINNKLVRRTGAAQLRDLNDRRTGVVGGGPILLRACRCGEDPIDDIREARVLQCMSCEGIVHVTPANQPQAYNPTPAQLRNNSYTAQRMFKLRRRK
jgi:hypothetical protein